jgi:hypothetical protein
MSAKESAEKSALIAGVKSWGKFPWVYLSSHKASHRRAEELNAQYVHKHIDTNTYTQRLLCLLNSQDVSTEEYTRSLHYLYARGDINVQTYLSLREPFRSAHY